VLFTFIEEIVRGARCGSIEGVELSCEVQDCSCALGLVVVWIQRMFGGSGEGCGVGCYLILVYVNNPTIILTPRGDLSEGIFVRNWKVLKRGRADGYLMLCGVGRHEAV